MNFKEIRNLALQIGFSEIVPLDIETMVPNPEVRKMCEQNSCGQYASNWSCPPACGTLETCQSRIRKYSEGVLLQTVGKLEDEFDGEGMIEIQDKHKANYLMMYRALQNNFQEILALGTGCCTQCKTCTYPGKQCNFPEYCISSMEAYGLLVTEICKRNGLQYYYGPKTISYVSGFLFHE